MDYHALRDVLTRQGGGKNTVDVLDYAAVDQATDLLVRVTKRIGGKDAALALAGFRNRSRYEAVFTNGENVGIPLALLLKSVRRRPGHTTIGHRLSTGKKRLFFQNLRAQNQIDTIFVYSTYQQNFAAQKLAVERDKIPLIPFHADNDFYRPLPDVAVNPNQICAAGLEWRDYPTLIEAVAEMPDLSVRLAAASPWSKHQNETEKRPLPPNVDTRRYEYDALRELYASSLFVVVPLYENDFQAGVTTLLEAMAMGKAVIVTQTTGQTDVIVDGENGLTVPPGDAAAWRNAIERLRRDSDLRERLGANARQWVEQHATLKHWSCTVADAIVQSGTTAIAATTA